jgi:hypothetical protein
MRAHEGLPDDETSFPLWRRLRCTLSEGHDPVRHPLGGFRCSRCGKSGASLEQFGFEGEGYVSESARRRLAQGRAA